MPVYRVQGPDGKIYKVQGPAGAKPEQITSFVASQVGGQAPVSSRQATQAAAQQQVQKRRKEEQGFLGGLYDSVFGADTTVPKALTETQQSARITDIAAERQKLLAQAAQLEATVRERLL